MAVLRFWSPLHDNLISILDYQVFPNIAADFQVSLRELFFNGLFLFFQRFFLSVEFFSLLIYHFTIPFSAFNDSNE